MHTTMHFKERHLYLFFHSVFHLIHRGKQRESTKLQRPMKILFLHRFMGRLHGAFSVASMLYDKRFVVEARDIGAHQWDFLTWKSHINVERVVVHQRRHQKRTV
jgi:hypothetical protein